MKLAVASIALALASLAPAAHAQSLEELEEAIQTERDEVDPGTVEQIAELETRESMEALLRAYDTFASVYMRREVVRELKRFDEHEDSFQPALDKLMNVAVGAKARELRQAALENLGLCTQNGPTFLALIVESSADDGIRERAMELHVRISGDSSDEWYRKIYQRKMGDVQGELRELAAAEKKRKKKRGRKKDDEEPEEKTPIVWPTEKLRATAMGAIIQGIEDDELIRAFEQDRSMEIRRAALAELAARDHKSAPKYAEAIIARPDFRGTDRALAAEILLKNQGTDAAPELIDVALKAATQEVLRQRIADMLSDLDDEDVDKKLLKLVGKGKSQQKTFALRATQHISDEKLTKKIRKGLRDKDQAVTIATIDALAARRDRESVEDLEKLLEKTKSDDVRAAVLRGLSTIYDGENVWVERLVEYTDSDDLDMRNSALAEIARLGRRNTVAVFEAKLSDPNWSTRLICLRALADQREKRLLKPIIDQMQGETGRMLVEFGDTLFRLTGQTFGTRATAWSKWLVATGDEVEILDESEVERLLAEADERRLRQISNAEFFGIRIESHRVLFIIDVSGSMNEPVRAQYVGELGRPRIDVAKEELIKALRSLDAKALFNIVPFSGGVDSWLEDGVVGADDYSREDAILYVDRLGAAGGTNLFGSLEFAFDDPDVDTIFLLSDGEPSVGDLIDPQLIRDEIDEMNSTRNVVINTIAIGADLQILEWLAEDSGGTHVSID